MTMSFNKKIFILWLISAILFVPCQAQVIREDEDNTQADNTLIKNVDIDTLVHVTWPQSVQRRLDSLLKSKMFETSQVGLMVYDLDADSAVYKYNERQLLRPASTMKVITAITAIDRLGGSFQFKTELCYTGHINNRTLTGDVYCVGGFDPRFNGDDMRSFVESIHKMGVDTIRGRMLADISMKDDKTFGEGWCWDDDNPTLSPLLISRKDIFMSRFIDNLNDAGIILETTRDNASKPDSAYCISSRSHSIDQILMRMLKESDNLYAESMFYQIAASAGSRPATAKNACSIISKLINKIGLKSSNYKIADGSGLSLYDYVSVELEVLLLRYAYKANNIYLHLYPALPIAGQDGTLEKRMREPFTSGNVHAKTGTVTGISSLAGYCKAANGHNLCFAIINQGLIHGANGRAFQDRVCEALCRP
jgi:D-alanyl-D-alanine carboxypeptidase/D-alanyl-D-alanine-endopeptidase (penicillin-binding protein 4)